MEISVLPTKLAPLKNITAQEPLPGGTPYPPLQKAGQFARLHLERDAGSQKGAVLGDLAGRDGQCGRTHRAASDQEPLCKKVVVVTRRKTDAFFVACSPLPSTTINLAFNSLPSAKSWKYNASIPESSTFHD
jgi:hypothetical protein